MSNPSESQTPIAHSEKGHLEVERLRLIAEATLLAKESHDQSMSERKQRQRIGGIVAKITIALPIAILLAFWIFFIFFSQNADTTLLSVMFSTTHISIVLLYFALIRGMFQADKQDGKTPIEQLSALN